MLCFPATYRDGAFQPHVPVELPENTGVRVTIEPISPDRLMVGKLSAFLQSLPSLGDDAEQFAKDVLAVRENFRPQ